LSSIRAVGGRPIGRIGTLKTFEKSLLDSKERGSEKPSLVWDDYRVRGGGRPIFS